MPRIATRAKGERRDLVGRSWSRQKVTVGTKDKVVTMVTWLRSYCLCQPCLAHSRRFFPVFGCLGHSFLQKLFQTTD